MRAPFRLSANISMLFPDRPFPLRIAAAGKAGFAAVECQFPYEFDRDAIAAALADAGLPMNSINTPTGDLSRGEFGFAALPGRRDAFRAGFERALEWGAALRVATIHCMSGAPGPGDAAPARAAFLENLRWAAPLARAEHIDLVIEPLNSRDRPGYFVSRSDDVASLLAELGEPNVKLLFDVYHIQIMEGDVLTRLARHWPAVGHVQVAGVPARTEPDVGELAIGNILRDLAARGWSGFVGAEYNPAGATEAGLGWAAPWLTR
jgi:hydroxypyruvate isomerase